MNFVNPIATGIALLKRYREKLGVGDYTELTDDEKKTYDQWEAILTKEITLENLREFLGKQQLVLAKELREAVTNGEERKALRISARLDNYEAMAAFIDEPTRSRDNLIAHLKTLVD